MLSKDFFFTCDVPFDYEICCISFTCCSLTPINIETSMHDIFKNKYNKNKKKYNNYNEMVY